MKINTISPASINAPPPRASLLGLPAELRVVIYELVIPLDPNRFIGTADWQRRIILAIRGALAIEHTCRLLRREIMSILDDPKSPRFSRLELINFTPVDMRFRTFEGTGSKNLNRSCFECPKITSIKALKSAYGLCKRGVIFDLDTNDFQIFTCTSGAREQLKQYCPDRSCVGATLANMVPTWEMMEDKRLSTKWLHDGLIANLGRCCAFPRRPVPDWAALLRTGLPKEIAGKFGGEDACEFEARAKTFAQGLFWGPYALANE